MIRDWEWQLKQDAVPFEEAWLTAITGKGSPYYSMDVFRAFAEYVCARNAIIEYTEVFEQTEDGLMVRTDLGMWSFPKADLPSSKKFYQMRHELDLLIGILSSEAKSFSVKCRLDLKDGSAQV